MQAWILILILSTTRLLLRNRFRALLKLVCRCKSICFMPLHPTQWPTHWCWPMGWQAGRWGTNEERVATGCACAATIMPRANWLKQTESTSSQQMSTKFAREQSKLWFLIIFCGLAFTDACGHILVRPQSNWKPVQAKAELRFPGFYKIWNIHIWYRHWMPHSQSMTTIHSWEQEKGCTELYNTLILSHFLLKGSSWSTCQSTLDLATDELGKSQNCQKSVFVSSQTVPKISPQICQCDMIVFFCNVHGWFVSNKLFVVSHYLIHWTKTHIDWRATYVCIGKVAHVLRKSPPACTNTKMHKYAQICTN